MSYDQWLRVVSVTISGSGGSITVGSRGAEDGLKVEFSATKTIGSKQNEATISVWNLSKSHRKQLGEEFDKITLEAGYIGGEQAIIFKGNIRDVKHTLEGGDGGTDVKSEMTCGDGDEAVNKGAISKTFPKGTEPQAMIDEIVKTMPGITKGQVKGLDSLPKTKRPYTVYGFSFRQLDELGRQHKFYWSIQNEQFQAVKSDEHLEETVVLSRDTGLIGVPTLTDKGIQVKALLNPRVAPGMLIDVRSEFLDEQSGRDKKASDEGGGLFRVSSATFSGTNRGQDFYVGAEGNRVQGGKVVK